MKHIVNFFKGIIVGIGGVAPGLSGSVLLTIFGLYQKTVDAIGNIFADIKKNIIFLTPLFAGFGVGVFLFSKVINFLLTYQQAYTRYLFLGLILGTIPLFYKEATKKGFKNRYFFIIAASYVVGTVLMLLKGDMLAPIQQANFFQSVALGFTVAASTIIPGVDSATILSALGLYELYLSSIETLNFSVLLPAAIGLGFGVLGVSFLVSRLLKKRYALMFAIIFGLFASIIPSVLTSECSLSFDVRSINCLLLVVVGFWLSFSLSATNNTKGLIDMRAA